MFELNAKRLTDLLENNGQSLAEYTLEHEISSSKMDRLQVLERMRKTLEVMKESATQGLEQPIQSISGMSGGNSFLYQNYRLGGNSLLGEAVSLAVAMALSSSEVNASMRRIVACPTAGSCGIVPASLLSIAKKENKTDDEIINALFTASGVGLIIGSRATLSGAEGGCQAECGSAAAMAAAGIVELMGGSVEQSFNAAAMTIKNVLGLVCDPVAGLVEVPCVKRNASGAMNALLCADMALAGVKSYIPFDDTVDAMYAVGRALPESLRETALGGLATTQTGKKLKAEILKSSKK